MNVKLFADVSPSQQKAAIDRSKNKPQNIEEMAEGEIAIFEISQTWRKTEDWVKRYLAATFLIMLSFTGGISMSTNDNHDFERVRMTRRKDDV